MFKSTVALGRFVKARRKEIGKSQVKLAKEVGVAQGTISNIENDKHPVSLSSDELEKLAQSLDTTVEQLMLFTTEASPAKDNIMPLVRVIVESGRTAISPEEFSFLVSLQSNLGQQMSPALVKEILQHRPNENKGKEVNKL
jgi:transcriptional regulator with XRE-family HTH domain